MITKEEALKKIEYIESKINELVYALYGLTEEEVDVIENGWKPFITQPNGNALGENENKNNFTGWKPNIK